MKTTLIISQASITCQAIPGFYVYCFHIIFKLLISLECHRHYVLMKMTVYWRHISYHDYLIGVTQLFTYVYGVICFG